jgi:5-carboxymethyl-2-hydroxymuconate isomerase
MKSKLIINFICSLFFTIFSFQLMAGTDNDGSRELEDKLSKALSDKTLPLFEKELNLSLDSTPNSPKKWYVKGLIK